MNNFQELKNKRPELAEMLETMSKEELLNHYALEVAEKDELAEFKNTYDDYQTDLECIVNSAKWWLDKHKKTNHYLHISTEKIELIQKENVVTRWI